VPGGALSSLAPGEQWPIQYRLIVRQKG